MPTGAGPRHLAFHPRQPFAYVINELQSTVTVLRYDRSAFEALQTISTLPADFTGQNLGAEIKVAPSGRFVYALSRGHDSLAIYAANQDTSQLSLAGHESTQSVGPRDFAIDPSGAQSIKKDRIADIWATGWPPRIVMLFTLALTLIVPLQWAVLLSVVLSILAYFFFISTSTLGASARATYDAAQRWLQESPTAGADWTDETAWRGAHLAGYVSCRRPAASPQP